MPCTTFFDVNEQGDTIPVPELQEWLEDVRKQTGKHWIVLSSDHKPGGFFSHKQVKLYSLFVNLSGGEYQQINFFKEHNETSFGFEVTLDVLAAYLMGKSN